MLVVLLPLAGCKPEPALLAFVAGPQLVAEPDPDVGLVYRVQATLSRSAVLVVEATGGRRFALPSAVEHDVALVGWPAASELEVAVRATDADEVADQVLTLTTPPTPAGFPPITVVHSEPEGLEPGDTLFAANAGGVGTESWVVRVDAAGRVIGWLRDPGQVLALAQLDDGALAYLTDKATLRVVEPDGVERTAWHAEGHGEPSLPGVPSLYHDFVPLPDGAFAVLSFALREVDGYPTDERAPSPSAETATVVSTTVLELDAAGVRSTLALGDLLDPLRVGFDGVDGGYWDGWLPEVSDPKDWGHGNGLYYDPVEDQLLVSLRNQDAVVAVSRATGELGWVVAPAANWRPPWNVSVLTWTDAPYSPAYHQHGPNLSAERTLLLFDNGNRRASAGEAPLADAQNVSRALELSVDPASGIVRQLWEYGPDRDDRPYCGTHGGAEALDETGHVLVTFGSIENRAPEAPTARIVEVDRQGRVYLELAVGPDPEQDWKVFRAYRVPVQPGTTP